MRYIIENIRSFGWAWCVILKSLLSFPKFSPFCFSPQHGLSKSQPRKCIHTLWQGPCNAFSNGGVQWTHRKTSTGNGEQKRLWYIYIYIMYVYIAFLLGQPATQKQSQMRFLLGFPTKNGIILVFDWHPGWGGSSKIYDICILFASRKECLRPNTFKHYQTIGHYILV